MKSTLIIIALVLSLLPLFAQNRNEVVWWEEDFESGAPGLDTPERVLADSNAVLTFNFYCYIQEPAGATAPYDGWDAFNVRISTNGGNTWTPISGYPAYNITSSYAFGAVFGEGPGIPGWGGSVTAAWGDTASFDLSSYIGQSVKIRFAFASDDSISYDLIRIYNITFGGYSNWNDDWYSCYAMDDGQMTVASLGPPIEDIWHVATDVTAPLPTHIMKFQNAQGTYDPFVRGYLVSPPIQLPDNGGIRADFMFRGGLSWNDYVLLEIAGNDGIWNYLEYIQPANTWSVYNPSWWSLADYAGQTVRCRWTIVTYSDIPQGSGFMLDDFRIYHSLEIAPPQNLQSVVNGNDVTLTWTAPSADSLNQQVRDVDYYRVFRDDNDIALLEATQLTYTDLDVSPGMHHYSVTAFDDVYGSSPSNTVAAYILSAEEAEFSHDDNSAETGFTVGHSHQMAVKFSSGGPVALNYVKVYVDSVGSSYFIIRVYADDGPNGLPGPHLLQFTYPPGSIVEGWNWIAVPENLILPAGQFYIGIYAYSMSPHPIGLDTSSHGFSYKKTGLDWEPVTEGEIMLHAIVEPVTENEDNAVPPLSLAVWNSPNPFNTETTISYTLPAKGQVCLAICNSKGQLVKSLLNEPQAKGEHTLAWNGKDDNGLSVASGLYLCRITSAGKQESRKLLLLK